MSLTRTDKSLNSRTAKNTQGLVKTCQVLDQSLPVPLLALQVLDQSLPVLGNPGDTRTRTGTRKNPKPIQGPYGLNERAQKPCCLSLEVHQKNISGPNIQISTSKTAVFKVLAGQLRNSRHWQRHQRAGA